MSEIKTVNTEFPMVLLRNALESPEDRWADLHQILPLCLGGTELVVRGDRPSNDLEDLGTGLRRVFEGIYKRRENPAVQLDTVTPEEVAARLERIIQLLRNMRSINEVELDLDKISKRQAGIHKEFKALGTCDHDAHEVCRLQQQGALLMRQTEELHQEKQQREQWKLMVLESLVHLDDYICIRK